jgi:hypothetical protein
VPVLVPSSGRILEKIRIYEKNFSGILRNTGLNIKTITTKGMYQN